MTDASRQRTLPDAVEKEVQGCGEVKETDELDMLLQYCEEIFRKVVYIRELAAKENNAMEWNNIELETGETCVGQNNYEDVAGKEFDAIGLEANRNYDMEWNHVGFDNGEMYVGQNKSRDVAGKVLDIFGLEMEWSNMELESGEVYVGQNTCEDMDGKRVDAIVLVK